MTSSLMSSRRFSRNALARSRSMALAVSLIFKWKICMTSMNPLRIFSLRIAPGQPVQNQDVLFRDDQLLHLEDIQVPLKDPDGQVVWNHQPLRRVRLDLAAEFAVSGDFAEDVAHRHMDPIGKLAQHGPLCALAAAWHSEQDN